MDLLPAPFHFAATFLVTVAAFGGTWVTIYRPRYVPEGERRRFLFGFGLAAAGPGEAAPRLPDRSVRTEHRRPDVPVVGLRDAGCRPPAAGSGASPGRPSRRSTRRLPRAARRTLGDLHPAPGGSRRAPADPGAGPVRGVRGLLRAWSTASAPRARQACGSWSTACGLPAASPSWPGWARWSGPPSRPGWWRCSSA